MNTALAVWSLYAVTVLLAVLIGGLFLIGWWRR
ncbi:MAG: hypothetical protein RLZZ373_3744 [Pseudomonadota bacterium]